MENIKPPDPVVPLTVDELEAELLAEPWLGPYVEVGDIDLNAARVRFEVDQISARRVLIDANVSVALRYRRGALQTTSIDERRTRPAREEP